MQWTTFIIIFVTLVQSTLTLDVNQVTAEIKPLLESLIQKNSLMYEESCDYEAEKAKQKYEKDLLNLMSSIRLEEDFNLENFKNNLVSTISSIVKVPNSFCNGYKNLQCNPEGRCDCAAVDETYGFKMNFQREGNACLILPGSLCAPNELVELTRRNNPFTPNIPLQEYRCASKATCIVKQTGNTCTMETMQAEYRRQLESHMASVSNPIEFLMQKTKEGICVCKGASIYSSSTFSLVISISVLLISKFWIL